VIQSRIASLVASFSVFVPNSTERTRPEVHSLDVGRLPAHVLGALYTTHSRPKRAQTVDVATPTAGAGLGHDPSFAKAVRLASPRALFSLCAGVEQVPALRRGGWVEALRGERYGRP
jgi:hypothetical protein